MDVKKISMMIKSISGLDNSSENYSQEFNKVLSDESLNQESFFKELSEILLSPEQGEALRGELSKEEVDNFIKNFKAMSDIDLEMIKVGEQVAAPGASNAGTTTANTAPYPVPIGSKMLKRKHESTIRRLGVGSYEVEEGSDADEELKDLI